MSQNDIALFLDLDNVVIGAAEANLKFDINEILHYVQKLTNGRIVLRRAYGDWRQHEEMPRELASAGFELQSTVRLSHMSKNLADMQMVVDSMDTLIDGRDFTTYVLVTGDRDFMPLVQALRKRGKYVIGIGVKHTASKNLLALCDQFVYYEDLVKASEQLYEAHVEMYLRQALDDLLKDQPRVPASLLKQQMQLLSRGAFLDSQEGRQSFRKLLAKYPHLVQIEQEETTLFVSRPASRTAPAARPATRRLEEAEVESLLQRALGQANGENGWERASLLKQRMQELSEGAFDESFQGDRSFRKFLKRYPHRVELRHKGPTLYVHRVEQKEEPAVPAAAEPGRPLAEQEVESLLQKALTDLLRDEPRVRASLLKQRLQELSSGAFDETQQGANSFHELLGRYPHLLTAQQKGSTLYVTWPQAGDEPLELHLRYRNVLKKRGLRVVPADVRLLILKDIIALLQSQPAVTWRQLIDDLAEHYQGQGQTAVSKNYIQDVLRVARRAQVIHVGNGDTPLADSPIHLRIGGERLFQDTVMLCDATYLREIETLPAPFDPEAAALALYETTGRARYLKVVRNLYGANGRLNERMKDEG
ncbi:MAG: NYN domain-containing protein [Chloroflexota bacterium]